MKPREGLGVSPGRTAGPVYRMAPPPTLPAAVPEVTDPAAEAERATGALRFVSEQLAALSSTSDGTAAEVLDAASMMAADPTLAASVAERVKSGRPAPWAVTEALA